MADKDPLAEAICAREENLRAKRAPWESLWQMCARYALPNEATFTERVTGGNERTRQILDSTSPRSLEMFASFLHGLMNNPSQQWFGLDILGVDKLSVSQAKYLDATAISTLRYMVKAKVYDVLHQAFLSAGAFGTSVVFEDYGTELGLRHFHLSDCVIDEGEDGQVDSMYRQFRRTPRQIVQRWPAAVLGEKTQALLKDNRSADKPIRYMHAVFPTEEPHLSGLVPKHVRETGAPFISVWVDTESKQTMSTGIYWEHPYMVFRWYKAAGEIYGRSPTMTVLPAIRMANRMLETIIRGAEKLVDPPFLLPEGGMMSPLRLYPGGISFSDGQITPVPLVPPGASRIEMGVDLYRSVKQDIERGYFVPLFIDIDDKIKTATQVLQEAGERQRAVSPMVMRSTTELYTPLIERAVKLLGRNGQLEEPPQDVDSRELGVIYHSPLVASQRQAEGLALQRAVELSAPWMGVDQGAMDRYDVDEAILVAHGASGAPARLLRSNVAMRRLRKARQAEQDQQQMQAALPDAAGAAADLITAQARADA